MLLALLAVSPAFAESKAKCDDLTNYMSGVAVGRDKGVPMDQAIADSKKKYTDVMDQAHALMPIRATYDKPEMNPKAIALATANACANF
ncbi:hypothetical protein B0E48_16190 [Rhodanobacter sp. C03]|nr:hypothetical protein B0E48_16190 [Rhodanobacter sp. C03]